MSTTPDSTVDAATDEPADEADEEQPAAKFATLADFVIWWATVWEQKISSGQRPMWCARWFEHPEAVLRLEAMWRSFEAARTDPLTGMATWIRDIADHHMNQLTGPNSPFRRCKESGHKPPEPELSTEPVNRSLASPHDDRHP